MNTDLSYFSAGVQTPVAEIEELNRAGLSTKTIPDAILPRQNLYV
ncbi:hypothetical protein [Lysinibacillus sp. FJAT-14745]|nr:hypothetical protein [Lysinibacillus sp. FJAT-14745]